MCPWSESCDVYSPNPLERTFSHAVQHSTFCALAWHYAEVGHLGSTFIIHVSHFVTVVLSATCIFRTSKSIVPFPSQAAPISFLADPPPVPTFSFILGRSARYLSLVGGSNVLALVKSTRVLPREKRLAHARVSSRGRVHWYLLRFHYHCKLPKSPE